MRKLFILILVLFVFTIGCGNSSIDPNDDFDAKAPMPKDSPVYDDFFIPEVSGAELNYANDALNVGVEKLGDLNGYAQFSYGKFVTDKNGEEEYAATKLFIRGNSVKISSVFKTGVYSDKFLFYQRTQTVIEFSLGEEITDFTLGYYYITGEVNEEKVIGSSGWGNWRTVTKKIGEQTPLLIKNTPTILSATSFYGNVDKLSTPKKYLIIISPKPTDGTTVDFSKEIDVYDKF